MPAPVGNFLLDKGRTAEAAITKYRAVKAGTGEESVIPVAADTDLIEGVAQFGVTADEMLKGKQASIRLEGITPWEAGGAIGKGVLVGVDAVGRCIALASGKRAHGRNVGSATTASGQMATIELTRNGHLAA